jgi:hypothetical protein
MPARMRSPAALLARAALVVLLAIASVVCAGPINVPFTDLATSIPVTFPFAGTRNPFHDTVRKSHRSKWITCRRHRRMPPGPAGR